MKKTQEKIFALTLMFVAVLFFASCNRKERIDISTEDQQLSFPWSESEKTVAVKANCSWAVENVNNVDWLTIESPSGRKDGSFKVKVTKNDANQDREAMIKVVSEKGKASQSIKVLQATDIVSGGVDFSILVNSYWGLSREEQWNTDFYNEVIPDTYKLWEFDPNDTTTGYVMFFVYSDSLGYFGFQKEIKSDSSVYYRFNYSIDSINNQVLLSFEQFDTTQVEEYAIDVQVLNASTFKFWHEYKPHFFERSKLSLLGTINPESRGFVMPKSVGIKPADSPLFKQK